MYCKKKLFCDISGIANLDLSGWDTSNVTDMSGMFYGSDINHPLHFDTSSVTDMNRMFSDSKYNHPLDTFDFSSINNIDNVRSMFKASCYLYPIKLIDTLSSKVEGYNDILQLHHRNNRFQKFLQNGECDDVSRLMDDFADNEEALMLIKQAHLKHSCDIENNACVTRPIQTTIRI